LRRASRASNRLRLHSMCISQACQLSNHFLRRSNAFQQLNPLAEPMQSKGSAPVLAKC
jgi:hypothetical protein